MGGGEFYFSISPNLSNANTKVLKRTNQEYTQDGPDGISRAVHAVIDHLLNGACQCAWTCFDTSEMINELRTMKNEVISG